MGYTHYWSNTEILSPLIAHKVYEAVEKVITICKRMDIELTDGTGEPDTEPECLDGKIVFNGLQDDGHETFWFQHNSLTKFQFCKTSGKPYDAAVTAVLVILKQFMGNSVSIRSDGELSDWSLGIGIAAEALDMEIDFRLDESE